MPNSNPRHPKYPFNMLFIIPSKLMRYAIYTAITIRDWMAAHQATQSGE